MDDSKQALTELLKEAVTAVQGAIEVGEDASADIADSATDAELKAELKHGSRTSTKWRERFDQVTAEIGADQGESSDNPIMTSINDLGRGISEQTNDPVARNLGIIATGQIALHYYIASFDTLHRYTKLVGMQGVGDTIAQCLAEAKQSDERYTELAAKIAA